MNTIKKIWNFILKIVTWLLVAFAVFMMIFTIVTVTTVDKNDRSIFGVKFYIVQTDSMSLSENNAHMDVHFNAGDIVIIKNVKDPRGLQEGDVIAFMSTNSVSYGETVTHMIREVRRTEQGQVIGYVTYGTNTGVDDEALVEPEYVLGSYAGKLPAVGKFFAFVKSVPGYIICILVPFLLLILYNGINVIRLFRRYKREQMEVMQAEKDKIDAERAETQRMMQELLALKAQLEKSGEGTPATIPASEEISQEVTDEKPASEEISQEVTDEKPASEEISQEVADEKPASEEISQEVTDEKPASEEISQEVTDENQSV
ncbi:MAG: signal peptidase I [Clostridia bacterium]|nr:signal peptidase I [Clostridia bacterium]